TVDAGSMYMDRILVTSKLDCTPKDKGDNCLEPVLDFVVNGISPGQELKPTDKPVVEAQLIDNTIFGAAFSFYFDNNSSNAAKDSAAPYCFQAEQNKCTSVSLSGLS